MNKTFAFTVTAFFVSLVLLIAVNVTQNQTISRLEGEVALLEQKGDPLKTLVFHVSEKGEDYPYARLPNASDTYNQLLALNNDTYEILLMPEYMGHQNWTEELNWIAETFGGPDGIPLMLCVYGGGEGGTTNPIPMLTVQQIHEATTVANIKWLRIAEVPSWHIQENKQFPADYIRDILEFAEEKGLKIFWTEWKNDYPDKNHATFTLIQATIQGYENIVAVSFSTNSNELEPADGFLKLEDMFTHWGASIQAWYWNTTKNSDLMNMPPSLLLAHAVTAKGIGAEILQFEPYWYFFDENGQANYSLRLVFSIIA